ncbi:cytochrome c biogenesis protein CcsA [Pseudomonadota bacterium]|nr:cytochrome c biogenesis protein CcsA [Pseudomonadota bacterium]
MLGEISHFLAFCSSIVFMACFVLAFLSYPSNTNSISIFVPKVFVLGSLTLITSFLLFVYLAIIDDFSMAYIASHSNSNLPIFYKVSSIWSAHEGSLFLWVLIISLWGLFFLIFRNHSTTTFYPQTIGIISLVVACFLLFLLFISSPFERILPFGVPDGADINPILQDPALAIHPPMLYFGYIGFVIPFAFVTAFLISGRFEKFPIAEIKSFILSSWIFLTIGIALGSWWAYYELGWGGYWFWDPVENVALMPWLAGTALLHTVYVSSRSKNLIAWTIFLSILAFTLSLFGAFIVRSGIIDSVHSFANDPTRGLYLLGMSAFLISAPIMLFIKNLSKIFAVNRVKDFSKEFFIGANNVFFITAVFIIFLGISYPLILEAFSDSRVSVGSPFYNKVFAPLTFITSLFLVFSTYSKWSRDIPLIEILKSSAFIFAITILSSIAVIYFVNNYEWWLIGGIFFGNLILIRYIALIIDSVISKKYFNQGSALAHIGFALLIASVSLNAALSSERTFSMSVGDEVKFNENTIEFDKISLQKSSNFESLSADFIFSNGEDTFELYPEKRKYFVRGEITTESDISIKPLKDVYITIGEQQSNGKWIVNVQENYFVRLIWISAIIMSLGAVLVIRRKIYV